MNGFMLGAKKWYQSLGVWGSLGTIVAGVAAAVHVAVSPGLEGALNSWSAALGVVITGIISLVGRIRATRQISSTPAPPSSTLKGLVAVLCLGMLFAAAGCNGTNPDTTQRTTITVEGAATVLNAIASARDDGLVTQAEVNQYKPIVDAFAAAKARAEQSLAAGDTSAFNSATAQLTAAYQQLAPFLQQINARKQPATRPQG